MTPAFYPHNLLDTVDDVAAWLLPAAACQGRDQLRKLRDMALDTGASVLILVWPSYHWIMLAVEAPADVVITDTVYLIPNLMANPEALARMLEHAKEGDHLVWLHLSRPDRVFH